VKLVWLLPVLASVASIVIEVSSGIIVIICCMYSSNIMALAVFRGVEVTLTSLIMNLTGYQLCTAFIPTVCVWSDWPHIVFLY
jgi:hypothetical protein